MNAPVIVWFRRDLRLSDHTALARALESGAPILPIFIFDPTILRTARISTLRLRFLIDALHSLDTSLRRFQARLIVRRGEPLSVLRTLIDQTQARALYFNRDYSPLAVGRDSQLAESLCIPIHAYDDAVLLPPQAVLKADGKPYHVYTPYKNAWNKLSKPAIQSYELVPQHFASADEFGLDHQPIPTLTELGHAHTSISLSASEAAAQRALSAFLDDGLTAYDKQRNFLPAQPFSQPRPVGSSYLSPYVRMGLLSPRQLYWAARQAYAQATDEAAQQSIATWVSELTWREFYIQILAHYPYVLRRDFVGTYETLEWRYAPSDLDAWKHGMTGYPIVDAAMRQLRAIGWMPNRARMIVASFLTKHLLIHWREGDLHFMRYLLDGDPAANNGGWQWSAGTGTDAQPYYRIFNPVAQSKKFDTDGSYIRAWLPELRHLSAKDVHAPWKMSCPPKDYPPPIVEHVFARQRALAAFKAARADENAQARRSRSTSRA